MKRREFIRLFSGAAAWSLRPASAQPVEDYNQYRTGLIEEYYADQLEALISTFRRDRKTVILLPGGMGSQLQRTMQAYPAWPNVPDDVIWLDIGIIATNDGPKLEIDDIERDKDGYVVAARGPIRFFDERPYQKLETLARDHWNYCVFGFDWRRPLKESSANFKRFIRKFQQRVRNDFDMDPIPDLTIVCHSMGGLVATHALRDADFSSLGFNAVITIATPFYGTSTQHDRYFLGQNPLNVVYGAKDVVRIIASLPGPYTLMFLPKAVYDRDHKKIGLRRYPELDPSGSASDPFDRAMKPRWPKVVRDHWPYIEEAKNEMIAVAAPINANILPKFFNVRSAMDTQTVVEIVWEDTAGDTIDPEHGPSPLRGLTGAGDGTVPAWSAFHSYCANENRHDLTQTQDTEHAYLLNHDEVLTLIENAVTGRMPSAAHQVREGDRAGGAEGPAIPSPQDLDAAVSKWVAESRGKQVPPPPEVQRAFVGSLIGGTKPRIAGRSTFTVDWPPKRARSRKPGRGH